MEAVAFLMSWKPSEKTTAFDFVLDGVKRCLANTDTLEHLLLHLPGSEKKVMR
jgi:hypothetical protein